MNHFRQFFARPVILLLLSMPSFAALSLNGFNIENPLIPANEIKRGGPPRDGIPALTNPQFIDSQSLKLNKAQRAQRVLAIHRGNTAKAYPVAILNFHELVNDMVNSQPILVSYCPLCGTGMVFSRQVKDKTLTFGVSGLLYNSNLLMYDRETESLWSQAQGLAISGPMKGTNLQWLEVNHLPLDAWIEKHPTTRVLSQQTGYTKNYDRNPYSGYGHSERLWFDVNHRDDRYRRKEWVVAVNVKGNVKAYPYAELAKTAGVIKDTVGGIELVISYDAAGHYATITAASGDSVGVIYSYWFSWIATFPDSPIYRAKN